MGAQSTKMQNGLKAAISAVKEEIQICDGQIDYLREQLPDFLNAPLEPKDKRKTIYAHMQAVSLKIGETLGRIKSLISAANSLLAEFQEFLRKKTMKHSKDLTSLQKKSLESHTESMKNAGAELSALGKRIETIPGRIRPILEHCKQAS